MWEEIFRLVEVDVGGGRGGHEISGSQSVEE